MARGGTRPYTTLNRAIQFDQANRVVEMHANGLGFRAIGAQLGISAATAWRRWWWLMDWTLPDQYGRPRGPFPPQRGTRTHPEGRRPCQPTLNHPEIYPPTPCRCGAAARTRNGDPCRNWPMRGAVRCRMHGAAASQVRRAARRRLAVAEVKRRRALQVHRERCEQGQPVQLRWH